MKINGETHYLWRAVDHEGEVLESFVTMRRDRKAALISPRKSMKRFGRPEVIVTDRLKYYGAAMKIFGDASRQATGRWLNNPAENSHLPFRRRERAMLRFRRLKSLQKFTAIHSLFKITSTKNATSTREKTSNLTEPLFSPSGGNFVPRRLTLCAVN